MTYLDGFIAGQWHAVEQLMFVLNSRPGPMRPTDLYALLIDYRPQPPREGPSMPSIPFTQFILPNGKRRSTSIEVSDDAAAKALQLIERGLVFECEILSTGSVSVTITDPEEGDLDIRIVANGPGVREAIEAMVLGFK